jgi:transposase-like protein
MTSSERWRALLSRFDPAKTTVRAFCRTHSINEHSFYQWRKKLREQPQQASPVSFKLVETSARTEARWLEIVLTSGVMLRVPCEEAVLRVVIAALG